ncbi:DALR domain-containing protein, partial [Chloroflexota bacterium]
IECSVMSLKYLGDTLDIHGGGQDLVFPHHENEIAQSENFTGVKPFVRYWLHNGLVQLGEEKMSKSLGNLITIKEALDKYSADAVRIFILSSHYRSPLTYSEEALEAAEKGAERLRQVAHGEDKEAKGNNKINAEPYLQRFTEAMDDDFNTPQAIATLFDLAREINRADESGIDAREARRVLSELANILGLTFRLTWAKPLDAKLFAQISTSLYKELNRTDAPDEKQGAEMIIGNLIELRKELRENKQWQQADMVRDKLNEAGISLEDTADGTIWKRKR